SCGVWERARARSPGSARSYNMLTFYQRSNSVNASPASRGGPMKALWRWLMAFGCAAFAAAAQAQVQWDMPTGYPANNFHSENIEHFRKDVEQATGGKLKIVVHPAGSLFKANEIKRAVQGGQAPIGEIIISGFSNED